MPFALRSLLCRFGVHRDFVKESRTFHRKVTEGGESIDAHEQRECRCGYVFESESHSTLRIENSKLKTQNFFTTTEDPK